MSPFDAAWLTATIAIVAPLLLAATGEVVSERAGVLNVGLEGYMLVGAFMGLLASSAASDSVAVGLVAAAAAGAATAGVMALATIRFGANQVVTGVGINLVALGLTGFLLQERADGLSIERPGRVNIPVLSDIPFIGQALFEQHLTTYLSVALVAVVLFVLYRTRLGIVIRACGDYPSAADTAGHSVAVTRTAAVLFAGAMAGLAGAQLAVVNVGAFQENMVNGRGFLALAAVVLGRWHPVGAGLAALLFAATDALQLRLQAQGEFPRSLWIVLALITIVIAALLYYRAGHRQAAYFSITSVMLVILAVAAPSISLPFQFWRALPFVATMAILGSVGSADAEPTFLTRPYRRE